MAVRYRIVLLVGDNLNDFTDDFAGKSIAERAAQVDRARPEFGTRFIVVLIRCMEIGRTQFS